MSSRSWLSYTYQNRFHLTPLSYESLEYASGFASEQCPEGIVAISTNTLRLVMFVPDLVSGLRISDSQRKNNYLIKKISDEFDKSEFLFHL